MRILLVIALLATRLDAATWYIDSSATGSNNGTSRANAWTAFSSIGTNTAAGDKIMVYKGSGTYARWTVAEGGTSTSARINVVGVDEGTGKPVITGINGAGFDYIGIYGMKFLHTSTSNNYAQIALAGAVGWEIYGCHFGDSYLDAITGATGGNNTLVIRNNYFENCGTISGGAAGGASGTSFANIIGDDVVFDYNTSILGLDRIRPFGTRWVIRNNYFGPTDTVSYASSSPYPFHSDSIQSYQGYQPLVQLLYERNYDKDNRDTSGISVNGHSFIVQDTTGPAGTFNTYIYRQNVTIRPADSWMIFRGVKTVAVYNNTNISIGVDHTTLYNNAVLFESTGQDIFDFRNNTFSYCPKMIDSGGFIPTSGRPSTFTSAANHSYNATGSQGVLPTGASPANLAQSAPGFTDGDGTSSHDDYTLTSGSILRAAAAYITTASGSGSSSTSLTVVDAKRLCDGWGIVDGDYIKIGSGAYVQISSISGSTVTLASARTWSDGDSVVVQGTADVGALPYGMVAASGTISNSGSNYTVTTTGDVRMVIFKEDGVPQTPDYTSPYTYTSSGGTVTADIYNLYASATPVVAASAGGGGGSYSPAPSRRPSASQGIGSVF